MRETHGLSGVAKASSMKLGQTVLVIDAPPAVRLSVGDFDSPADLTPQEARYLSVCLEKSAHRIDGRGSAPSAPQQLVMEAQQEVIADLEGRIKALTEERDGVLIGEDDLQRTLAAMQRAHAAENRDALKAARRQAFEEALEEVRRQVTDELTGVRNRTQHEIEHALQQMIDLTKYDRDVF